MYSFGNASNQVLVTLKQDIQNVLIDAIQVSPWDFSLVSGRRSRESQTDKFRQGFSQTPWPFSNHNSFGIKKDKLVPKYGEERDFYLKQLKEEKLVLKDLFESSNLVDAFDFIPYPQMWSNKELIASTSRWMQGFFVSKGIKLRLGTDWNNDGIWTEEKFFDGGHCERTV